jgi:hypothetical protein
MSIKKSVNSLLILLLLFLALLCLFTVFRLIKVTFLQLWSGQHQEAFMMLGVFTTLHIFIEGSSRTSIPLLHILQSV